MPTDPTDFEALVARAEKTGRTDEEAARTTLSKEMGNRIVDIMQDDRFKPLYLAEKLMVLAEILGVTIKTHRLPGPLSGALVAGEICQIIVDIATEKDN
jgi:hypothetical protein